MHSTGWFNSAKHHAVGSACILSRDLPGHADAEQSNWWRLAPQRPCQLAIHTAFTSRHVCTIAHVVLYSMLFQCVDSTRGKHIRRPAVACYSPQAYTEVVATAYTGTKCRCTIYQVKLH